MNDDSAEGQWQQLRSKLKVRWGELTDDDLQAPADGSANYLARKLREHSGIARGEAKTQINTFFDTGTAYRFKPASSLPHLNTLEARRSTTQG